MRRRRDPALLLCGPDLVFATAESENGLLSLWLRRHTTALALGLVMRGARSFQAFELYKYKACSCSRLSHSLIATRLRPSPTIAAIFPPAVLKVRPPAAREVLGRGATTTIPHRKIADAERGAMPDGKGRALQVRAGNPNKDNDYLIDRAAQKGEDS